MRSNHIRGFSSILGLDNSNGLIHRGCFKNFTGDRHDGLELLQCQKICSATFRYIAIKVDFESQLSL